MFKDHRFRRKSISFGVKGLEVICPLCVIGQVILPLSVSSSVSAIIKTDLITVYTSKVG